MAESSGWGLANPVTPSTARANEGAEATMVSAVPSGWQTSQNSKKYEKICSNLLQEAFLLKRVTEAE